MRLNEFTYVITEGVSIHSIEELAAFAVTVAEQYDRAPIHDPSVDRCWHSMINHAIDVLLPMVRSDGVHIEFVEEDPYQEGGNSSSMMMRYMLYDILVNKRLKIWSGESVHPLLDGGQNTKFRAIHDYLTHNARLMPAFKKNLEKVFPDFRKRLPTPDELKQLLPGVSLTQSGNVGHRFTLRGELNTASTHIRLAPKLASGALFTEVVGQVCSYVVANTHAVQKVALLPGFNYQKIGQTVAGSWADQRKQELWKILQRESDDFMIPLHLEARNEIKKRVLINKVKPRES